MRIRTLLLPGDRFALVVDKLNPDHLDSEAAVDAIERVEHFARNIGALDCLISVEAIELPDEVLEETEETEEDEDIEVVEDDEFGPPEVRPCTPRRMAVEVEGHGELAIPTGDVPRKLYVSLDERGPYLSMSPSNEALAMVDVPRSAAAVTDDMISALPSSAEAVA